MPDIKPFFSVNAWGDSLTTGATLKIVHSLHYSDYTASPHMVPLVELTAAELQEKLKDSKAAEKSIFDKLKTAVSEWEAQAAQTLLLEKVLEYVRTPEVSHTFNEWKQLENGAWEISNRVYQMRYQFAPVPQSKAVRVTWGIVYNTPQQPGNPRYANSWGTAALSPGRIKNRMKARRPPSGISRAGSTCTPTCSRSCPRLYPTTASGCSWSTATFSPATPLRPRNGQRRRPSTTCWTVWRTGTLRRPCRSRSSHPPRSRRPPPPPPRNLPGQRPRKRPALKNRGRCDRRRSHGIDPS